MKMSSVIVKPIARPAIDLKAPRGSAAVAKITQTRKKVRMISITSPAPGEMPRPSVGAPSFVAFTSTFGATHFRTSAPSTAARNCETQ